MSFFGLGEFFFRVVSWGIVGRFIQKLERTKNLCSGGNECEAVRLQPHEVSGAAIQIANLAPRQVTIGAIDVLGHDSVASCRSLDKALGLKILKISALHSLILLDAA